MWKRNGRRAGIQIYRVCSGDNTTHMLHADSALTLNGDIQGTTNRWNPIYLNMEYTKNVIMKIYVNANY